MKNDSPFFPIDTPMESFFDSNHDGKLSGMETAFRDATLMDSYEHFNEENDNIVLDDTDFMFSNIDDIDDFEFIGNFTTPPVQETKSEIPEGKFITTAFTDSSTKDYSNPPSSSAVILSSLAVVAVCVFAFMIIIKGNIENDFVKSLIMFGAVAVGIGIFKLTGVIAPDKEEVKEVKRENRKALCKKLIKPAICIIAILVVIFAVKGVKDYNYAADYRQAIEYMMNDDYSQAEELLNAYWYNDYKDSYDLYKLCQSYQAYQKGEYIYAYLRIDDVSFNHLHGEKRAYMQEKVNEINKAYHDYSNSNNTQSNHSTETTTAYHYTTQTTTKYNYTTKKHTTTKNSDPYNVNDYSDEEDFYEDHYDDFFDYYDAEDYYREHHD